MKCPNCNYSHGYDSTGYVEGADGDFWQHPVKAEKKEEYDSRRAVVHGCPQCGIMFLDTGWNNELVK